MGINFHQSLQFGPIHVAFFSPIFQHPLTGMTPVLSIDNPGVNVIYLRVDPGNEECNLNKTKRHLGRWQIHSRIRKPFVFVVHTTVPCPICLFYSGFPFPTHGRRLNCSVLFWGEMLLLRSREAWNGYERIAHSLYFL